MSKALKVLMVSPEVYPYSAVGGLSQATTFLSKALLKRGHRVEILAPFYGGQQKDSLGLPVNFVFDKQCFGSPIIYQGRARDLARFSSFGRSLISFLKKRSGDFDLVHSHDWYGALNFNEAKKTFPKIKTVLTVHSPISYDYYYQQEESLEDWTDNFVDFSSNDRINPWALALAGADLVNTVSEGFGREIAELFERVGKDRVGIVNGVDEEKFCLKGDKKEAKRELQRLFGLPQKDTPLFVYVGRVVRQKGISLLCQALGSVLVEKDAQFIALGEGDLSLRKELLRLKELFPRKVALKLKRDFELPKKLFAGADFLVLPSVVEPCGIVVLEGMRMGAVPLVRETGGLKDLVAKNGLSFSGYRVLELEKTLRQALELYENREKFLDYREMNFKRKFSWAQAAKKYEEFYLQ
jgi:starch synthase